VAVPTFVRNLHASRVSEAVRGVSDIAAGAMSHAEGRTAFEAFPPPAPLTPAVVPRGDRVLDPPDTWEHLTWKTLGFSIDHEHYFSFAFDSDIGEVRSAFVAHAHGDLDGDGERSTFELRGETGPLGPKMLPGLYVDREVE
jgi:hypothetical protein